MEVALSSNRLISIGRLGRTDERNDQTVKGRYVMPYSINSCVTDATSAGAIVWVAGRTAS